MRKYAVGIITSIVLVLVAALTVTAHDNNSHHDRELEYVLFGQENYKSTHPAISDSVQMLQDAAYLCLDQFNGEGKSDLEYLTKQGVSDIPSQIKEFDFTGNYAHRNLTHRGWNVSYEERAHWQLRQDILMNTIEKVFFSDETSVLSKIPFAEDIFGNKDEHEEQIESMAVFIYCVHVLGDHLEAEKYNALGFVDPLTRPNDSDNPGLIPDITDALKVLFQEQQDSYTYSALIQQLNSLENTSNRLVGDKGGVDTDEEFEEYHQCAEDLLEALAAYVPILLKKESYFHDVFYSK